MVTLANRVKVTSATTGTADTVSLGSAITGFQTFSEASITDGAQVRYVIEDGANFEIGVGTFQSPATLVRSDAKVSESTSSNNKINLSGNAIVFITASAEDIPQLKVLSTKTIDNPNYHGTSADDEFGRAVAVSGNYTVVGAPKEDELLGGLPYDNTGRAYIFDTDSGSLLHTLQDTVSDQNADFGISVDVSGKYAIIGAGGTNGESGSAYIFDVITGTRVHTLNNPNAYDTGALDQFGDSVSISGKYAIVGAPGEDDAAGLNSGKAYIFDVDTGTLLYTLDNPNQYGTSQIDQFAYSVSISGNHVVVGAPGEESVSANTTNSGQAYVYDISTFTTSTITSATYRLPNPTEFGDSTNDRFGTSVSISGNYVIVGAPDEDDANGNSSGKAYLYDISTFTSSLILSATHILDNPNVYGTSTNDQYGASVSISGNYAVVGAAGEDESSGGDSGKVYLYDISTLDSYIVPVASYTIANPNAYSTPTTDNFGSSVAISGNRVVVGAYNEDDANGTTSGKSYSFKLSTEPYAYTADEISLLASSSGGSTDYINSASFNTGTGVLSLTGEGNAGASVDLDGRYQLAGTYNTVIGTDSDIDTSGSTIIDNIYVTDGVITSMGTRTLTAGDIGAQPSGTYNTVIGTDTDIDTSGSTIIDNIYVTDGVITSMGTRTLTAGDIGALPSSVSNQNLNTTDSVTFAGLNINGILNAVDSIFLADNIYHEGDPNTYMQFHDEDQWRVVTGGSERLEVNNSYVTVQNDLIVNGGDIVLGGTGRIQGIDTVSSSTDAANKLYVDNAVAGAGGGGISNVVEDTTPQLGGTLDSNGNNIEVNGGGTFTVSGGGDVFFKDGTVYMIDLPSMGANAATLRGKDIVLGDSFGISGSLDIQSHGGTTGSLTVDGDVTLNGIVYPSADGTNGQVLTTDGSGNLSFTTSSGGGISNVVEDTTPQLGGNLDLNYNYIGHANAHMQAYDFGTGSIFEVALQGYTALEIYANSGSSVANVTINDDLTVQGGDITLGGTGRIQGIDTVSSDTDAANKLYVDNAVASAGGGISNVVEDTTPQLGGNLDTGFYYVGKPNSHFSVQDFGTGGYFTISMFGGDIIQAYSSVGPSSQSVTINGDVDIRNFGNLQFNSVTSKVDRHISNGVIESYDRYSSSPSSLSVSVQDNSTKNIQWISAALTSNVTLNITGITNPYNIPTSVNTISVMANVGSTGYIVNTVNVDGTNHGINWAGGSAPTPTTNAYNLFTFTIFWNNAAADIEVFGTHQGF